MELVEIWNHVDAILSLLASKVQWNEIGIDMLKACHTAIMQWYVEVEGKCKKSIMIERRRRRVILAKH